MDTVIAARDERASGESVDGMAEPSTSKQRRGKVAGPTAKSAGGKSTGKTSAGTVAAVGAGKRPTAVATTPAKAPIAKVPARTTSLDSSAKSALSKSSPSKPVASTKPVAPKSAAHAKPAVDPRLAEQLAAMTLERDRLREDLQAANRRIAALEAARQDAINRIDWVIDSLQSLAAEKFDD